MDDPKLDINRLLTLTLTYPEDIERLRKDFPHIYFPKEFALSDFLLSYEQGRNAVFTQISFRLLTQYMLFTRNVSHLLALKNERERKIAAIRHAIVDECNKQEMTSHLRTNFPLDQSAETPERDADLGFKIVIDEFRGRVEGSYEVSEDPKILPEDDTPKAAKHFAEFNLDACLNEIYESLDFVSGLTAQIIDEAPRQNYISAFTGLRRTVVISLKDIISLAKEHQGREATDGFFSIEKAIKLDAAKVKRGGNPEVFPKIPEWSEIDWLKDEPEQVHLLRSLSTNYRSLDTPEFHHFTSGKGKFRLLNDLRNNLEHDNKIDHDRLTTENLLLYFNEVRKLFEFLESNEDIARLAKLTAELGSD